MCILFSKRSIQRMTQRWEHPMQCITHLEQHTQCMTHLEQHIQCTTHVFRAWIIYSVLDASIQSTLFGACRSDSRLADIHPHVYMGTLAHTHVYTCKYTCIHVYLRVHTWMYIVYRFCCVMHCVLNSTCTIAHVHVYTYIHMYTCIHVYPRVHTWKYTNIQSPVHDAARAGSEKSLRLLHGAGADMLVKTGEKCPTKDSYKRAQ